MRTVLSILAILGVLQGAAHAAPTVEFVGSAVFAASSTWRGSASPGVSVSGRGTIYFDSTANKFQVSEHAGAYQPLLSLFQTSGLLYPAAITDKLAIGRSDLTTGMFLVSTNTTATPSLFVEATTGRVGIGTISPATALEVNGIITGIGSGLTLLNAGALVGTIPGSVLPSTIAYTSISNTFTQPQTFGSSITINADMKTTGQITAGSGSNVITTVAGLVDAQKLSGTIHTTNTTLDLANQTTSGNLSGSKVSGGTFGAVNGSALTNLNGSAVSGGTFGAVNAANLTNVSDVALSSNVVKSDNVTTFLSSVTVQSDFKTAGQITTGSGSNVITTAAGLVDAQKLSGTIHTTNTTLDLANQTTSGNLSGSKISGGTFGAVNGSALTNLNGSAVSGGTFGAVNAANLTNISDVALSSNIARSNVATTFLSSVTVQNEFKTTGQITAGSGANVITTAAGLLDASKLTGTLSGSLVSGGTFGSVNGSALTNLNGSAVSGGTFGAVNGSALTNLSGSAVSGGTFGAVNGSALTNLNGSAVSGGTFGAVNAANLTSISDIALSTNVAKSNVATTFLSSVTVQNEFKTTGQITAGTGAGNVITTAAGLLDASKLTGTLSGSLVSGGTFGAVNGSALTNLSAANVTGTLGTGATLNFATLGYSGSLSGSNISGGTFGAVNAANLTNISDVALSSNIARANTATTFLSSVTVQNEFKTTGQITAGTGAGNVITTAAGLLDASKLTGTISGSNISGGTFGAVNGSALTNLSGSAVSGGTFGAVNGSALTNLSAANVTGTLGTGATLNFATLGYSGSLSGSNISGGTFGAVNAANLTSISDIALSSNIAKSNVATTFLSSVTVQNEFKTTGQITAGAGAGNVITTAAGLLDASKLTGTISGSNISGGTFGAVNGSALTNLSAANVTGTLGTGATLNFATLGYSGSLSGSNISGGTFGAVNGSALTNLSGSAVSGGTFGAVNGSALTDLSAANVTGTLGTGATLNFATLGYSGSLSGSNISGGTFGAVNAANLTSISDIALSTNVAKSNVATTFLSSVTVQNEFKTTGQITAGTGAGNVITTAAGLLDASKLTGTISGSNISGGTFGAVNGSALTNLSGSAVSGGTFGAVNGSALTNLSAANVTGTLGTGATLNFATLGYSGSLSGSNISGGTFGAVNAANLTSISDIALSTNVAKSNVATTFLSSVTVQNEFKTTGQITAGTGAGNVITTAAGLLDASKLTGTISGSNISGGTFGAVNGSALTNLSGSAVSGGTFGAVNGSALTNLSAANVTGTLGTGATLNFATLGYSGSLSGSNISGGTFGAVNAANLTSISDIALSTNVAKSNVATTFLSSVTVQNEFKTTGQITAGTGAGNVITTAAGLLDASKLTGTISGSNISGGTFGAVNGSALTNLSGSAVSGGTFGAVNGSALTNLNGSAVSGGTFGAVNGSALTNLSAANVTGTLGTGATLNFATLGYSGSLSGSNISGGTFGAVNGSALTNLNGSAVSGGTFGAVNGSALTNLSAANVTGTLGTGATLNFATLGYSGSLSGSNISGGTFGAVNAANLTNLSDVAHSTNIARSNVATTFLSSVTVQNEFKTTGQITAGTGNGNVITTAAGLVDAQKLSGTIHTTNTTLDLANQTTSGNLSGSKVSGGTFGAVNGSALTNLSGSAVSGGTFGAVNGSALTNLSAANVTGTLGTGATLNFATLGYSGSLSGSNISGGTFGAVNGSALTNLSGSAVSGGTFGAVNAANLTNLSDVAHSTNIARSNVATTFLSSVTVQNEFKTTGQITAGTGNGNVITTAAGLLDASKLTGTVSGSLVSGGTFGAVNGSALTNLSGSAVSGGTFGAVNGSALTNLSAANVTGTLGTGATLNFATLGYSGSLSGSNVSGGTFGSVNAANLTSISDIALSSNVAKANVATTFLSSVTVQNGLKTTGQIIAGTGNGNVITTVAGLLDPTKVGTGILATDVVASSVAIGVVHSAQIQDATLLFADVAGNSCGANQVMKRNAGNTAWACANDLTAGGAITLAPVAADADSSANPSIFVNDTAGGNLLQLQTSTVDRWVIDNTGLLTIGSVGAARIANGTLGTQVVASSIAVNAVHTAAVVDLAVTTAKLAANSVSSGKYDLNSVIVSSPLPGQAITTSSTTMLTLDTLTLASSSNRVLLEANIVFNNNANTAFNGTALIGRGTCATVLTRNVIQVIAGAAIDAGTHISWIDDTPGSTTPVYVLCARVSASTVVAENRSLIATELGP